MNLSIFDIPHLKDEVTRYLSEQDLLQCILVSKNWHAHFTSVLWQHPLDNHKFSHRQIKHLVHFKNFVHSINGSNLQGKRAIASTIHHSFPYLKSLKIAIPSATQYYHEWSVLRFIESTQSLQTLDLCLISYRDKVHERLTSILKSHPSLREFSFASHQKFCHVYIQEIIQACSQLDSLKLSFLFQRVTKSTLQEVEDFSIVKDRLQLMDDTKIRKINFMASHVCSESYILPLLMQRCPLLETLTTRGLQDETLSDITRVLREGRCSLLKHVEISDPEYSTHKATIIEELLCSIGSMTSTTTDDTHVDRRGGLVTYIQGLGGKWSPAIIPCHAYTLTRLELSKSALFGLLTLSKIVYGLPKLLKLTIRIWLSSADEEVLATKGISKLKWICNGLTDLELAFDSYPLQDVLDPAWNGSCLDRSYTWLFSQIGELKMLRDLSLTSLFELLSLRSGPKYVEKLSELEQLRTLRLDIAVPRFIGAMEAEWMIEHWPRLIEVGITERYQNNLEEFCTILKDRRPRLRVDRKRE